jgi:hypothetical protein
LRCVDPNSVVHRIPQETRIASPPIIASIPAQPKHRQDPAALGRLTASASHAPSRRSSSACVRHADNVHATRALTSSFSLSILRHQSFRPWPSVWAVSTGVRWKREEGCGAILWLVFRGPCVEALEGQGVCVLHPGRFKGGHSVRPMCYGNIEPKKALD